jgi:hypothetical protein
MSARNTILKWAKELGGSSLSFELELDQFARELAGQQRQEMRAPGRSYDAARWNRCVDMVANVIDPDAQTPAPAGDRCAMGADGIHPAAVAWICITSQVRVCQACLDAWFDSADDDPDLEPAAWGWLYGCRPPATGGTVQPDRQWIVVGEDRGCILTVPPLERRPNLGISITDMAAPATHQALMTALRLEARIQGKPLHQLTG